MRQGWRIVEPERDVRDIVQISVRLERGDQHPIEWERRQDDQQHNRRIERASAAAVGKTRVGISNLLPSDETQHQDHHDQ